MSREIACELIAGPYDKQTGWLTIHNDRPQTRLSFNLEDRESRSTTLIVPGRSTVGAELEAWYELVDEKPRKVIVMEEVNGRPRARSELGVRYRYSKDSPCERLFEQAARDALLTSEAHDTIMATRRLLLDEATRRRDTT